MGNFFIQKSLSIRIISSNYLRSHNFVYSNPKLVLTLINTHNLAEWKSFSLYIWKQGSIIKRSASRGFDQLLEDMVYTIILGTAASSLAKSLWQTTKKWRKKNNNYKLKNTVLRIVIQKSLQIPTYNCVVAQETNNKFSLTEKKSLPNYDLQKWRSTDLFWLKKRKQLKSRKCI